VRPLVLAALLWLWPNARISVMGGEQAASVLATVRRDQLEAGRRGVVGRRRGGVQGADPRPVRATGAPYYATARLWDDGVIDPADTRTVLGLALGVAGQAPLPPIERGIFRM
jgi:3-methylcrotonyl-CoA carboxylase beta subunit